MTSTSVTIASAAYPAPTVVTRCEHDSGGLFSGWSV